MRNWHPIEMFAYALDANCIYVDGNRCRTVATEQAFAFIAERDESFKL